MARRWLKRRASSQEQPGAEGAGGGAPLDEKKLYIAHRTADLPVPLKPAQRNTCGSCGAEIWIANDSVAFAQTCDLIRCRVCAPAEFKQAIEDGEDVRFQPIPKSRT
ncbi:MAG: hypothetical protein WBM00_09690 [Solirubrobacterales bacterium]